MRLSVVIPVRNVAATIGQQLDSLARQDWQHAWEVIVVDNGSTDDTRAVIEGHRGAFAHLEVVDAGGRTGPGYARNLGVAAARADRIAFTDGDDVVGPHWIASMDEGLSQGDVVAGRLEFERLNGPEALRLGARTQEDGLQVAWYPPFLAHASGCNLGARRSVLEAVGGFSETLPCLTDTDLCFRLQAAGYRLVFAPAAVVHYRYRTTPRGAFRQARSWARVNTGLSARYRSGEALDAGSWTAHASGWLRLVRRLPRLRNPLRRGQVIRAIGQQLGLLEGALRWGVRPLVPPGERRSPASAEGPPPQEVAELH